MTRAADLVTEFRPNVDEQFRNNWADAVGLAHHQYRVERAKRPLKNLDEDELDTRYPTRVDGNDWTDIQVFEDSADTVLTGALVTVEHAGDTSTALAAGVIITATSGAGALYCVRAVNAATADDALVHIVESTANDQYALKVSSLSTLGTVNFISTGASGHAVVISGTGGAGGISVTGASTFANTLVVTQKLTASDEVEIDGALNHDGTTAGFYGVAPTTRPAALTQTYATATSTHANPTSSALTDSTGATPDTTIENVPAATGDAGGAGLVSDPANVASLSSVNTALTAIENSLSDLATNQNNDRTDLLNLKQFVNQIADYLQLNGLLQ